jgi:hypothetical protein
MRSIPHDDNLPVPEPQENGLTFLEQMGSEDGTSPEAIRHCRHSICPRERTLETKRFNQQELNDLM